MGRIDRIGHNGATGEHYGKQWEVITDRNERHLVGGRNAWQARQRFEVATGQRVIYLSEVDE